MARATSAPRAMVNGFPLSSASSSASSSACCSMRSASRHRVLPRSEAVIAGQAPPSKAERAASTARSTSSAVPWATSQISSSVAGSTVGNVAPLIDSTH